MQNYEQCPVIPENKEHIMNMAESIGMKSDTLETSIRMLQEEMLNSTCPLNVTKPVQQVPISECACGA
jgi:hypothetical protein